MKERDIVDFDKMEKMSDGDDYIDPDTGDEIGCQICYTHVKAAKILREKQFSQSNVGMYFERLKCYRPLCPDCGKPLEPGGSSGCGYAVVSEVNYANPEGEISYSQLWHCGDDECAGKTTNKNFAMIPIPITYNANHDIYYTGGRDYASTEDVEKLISDIFEKMKPSIQQYIRRKTNPEDKMDEMLHEDNVLGWCQSDIEHVICNYLYERGLKK